ncbi:MAG: transferrin-binding protein-like solute binding protein [Cardiobacteriaceae bacterium]|nr:transferrin-binding protein-like solute binding protein [Cardiobacteriaceae bacterium]
MKKLSLILLITSALILTACGGSSKDNTPADPPKNQPNTQNNAGNANNNTNSNTGNTDNHAGNSNTANTNNNSNSNNKPAGAYQGTALVTATDVSTGDFKPQAVGSDNLSVLNTDGKLVILAVSGFSSGGFTSLTGGPINGKSYKHFIVSGTNFANSKFGYVTEGDKDYIFSHGSLTNNMPSSGIVEYTGGAIVGKNGTVGITDASFQVNFDRKTLLGNIKPESNGIAFTPFHIDASINGNSFSTADNATVQSSGHFYGDNAQELGGVFQDKSQQLVGSFGAKKN